MSDICKKCSKLFKQKPAPMVCSFCYKPDLEVFRLFQSTDMKVRICFECVLNFYAMGASTFEKRVKNTVRNYEPTE